MYVMPDFLDCAMAKLGQTWKSDKHKKFAEIILLCNSRVTRMNDLMEGCRIINDLPDDKVDATVITVAEAREFGLPI